MFAHGVDDCREPVHDITESETGSVNGAAGAGIGDRKNGDHEDKTLIVDPKWNGNVDVIYSN
jgi:hypothetical protein